MAWGLVQSKKTTSVAGSGALSIAAAFGSSVTAGNRVFVYTCHNHSSNATDVNTPTDNQLNTYTKLVTSNTGASSIFGDIWTAVVASTGTLTVTVTTVGIAGGELGWTAQEYSGLDASAGSGCLDKSATGTPNNGTTSNAGSGTTAATTAANQLALSLVVDFGALVTWTVSAGGFTKDSLASLDADANAGIGVANKTSASGAAEVCTWTNGAVTDNDVACVAVIKLAAAAATSSSPLEQIQVPPARLGPRAFLSHLVRGRLAALALATVPGLAHTATAYFVSAAGSDAADGLTTGTAWQTITKVNATQLYPGDSVSFHGGDTFTGNIAPAASGTVARPIVYNSYGTGNATISATATDAFTFLNQGGFEVRNLTIVGGATSFGNGSGGVNGYATAGNGKRTYLLVDSCDVSGLQHGIIIGGDTTAEGFDQIILTNNTCHGNKNDGIALWGGAGGTAFSNSNVTITGNVCNNNLGDSVDTNPTGSGIVVGSTNTALIDQNVAHDNGGSNNASGGPVGIWCYDSTAVTIQRCLSYSNKTAGTTDGGGFDLDINVSNSTIQYCMAYNNDGPGYMFFASGTAVFTGNVLRYNVSWGNVRNTALPSTTYGELLIGGTVASSAVYGNTLYAKDNASNNISALVVNATPTGVTVRNNILVSQTGATVLASSAWATTAALMQGNDYWRPSGTSIKWGVTTYTTLAAWRAAVANQEMVGAGNVGLTVDPVFVSPTSTPTTTTVAGLAGYVGLSLQNSSPLVVAGLDLLATFGVDPGTRDFAGTLLTVPLSVGSDENDNTLMPARPPLPAYAVQRATCW